LETIGAVPEAVYEHGNAVEIHKHMLWPNSEELLTTKLHEALNIDKSLMWGRQADAFDAVNDISMHESVADETGEEVDNVEDWRVGTLADCRAESLANELESPCWSVTDACNFSVCCVL
jgi:hypothetical protein